MKNLMLKNQCTNNDSYVKVTNDGGFFAEFYISYISSNGQQLKEDSGAFALGESRKIEIEEGAAGVRLQIYVWFLSPAYIVFNKYIETYNSRCFTLYGTIFNPSVTEVECTDDPPCCNCNQFCDPCDCRICNENTIPVRKVF